MLIASYLDISVVAAAVKQHPSHPCGPNGKFWLHKISSVPRMDAPGGQLTLTSLSSFQKPSTTRDRMHLALRPASQRRALWNEQPWRFLSG